MSEEKVSRCEVGPLSVTGASDGCSNVSILVARESMRCCRPTVRVSNFEASSKTPLRSSSACLDSDDNCLMRFDRDPFVTHSNSLTMLMLAAAAALAAKPCPVSAGIFLMSGLISPGGRGSVDLHTLTGSITRCWRGIVAWLLSQLVKCFELKIN